MKYYDKNGGIHNKQHEAFFANVRFQMHNLKEKLFGKKAGAFTENVEDLLEEDDED